VLIYLTVAMVVLIAMASLAVDVGRVRVVKAELQLAADAAARYGAAGLAAGGPTQARSNAVAAANDNFADGTRVALDSAADVELGTWDPGTRTFTAAPSGNENSATAIRVTARRTAARGNATSLTFARIVGMNAVDLSAHASARTSRRRPGIVGLASISMSGNTSNSYRSSTYVAGTVPAFNQRGTIQTNGDIRLSGGATVYGDAYTGAGRSVSSSGGSSVIGTTGQLTATLDYPAETAGTASTVNNNAAIPSTYLNAARDVSIGSNVTLPGGVYYLDDITVSGSNVLTFSAPATLYVTGDIRIGGGVRTAQDRPANLRIVMVAAGTFDLSGSGYIFADIYAPQSAFGMSGGSWLLGSVIAGSITMTGGSGVVFDEDLGISAAGVSLVQ
jgi:hypothetical protein